MKRTAPAEKTHSEAGTPGHVPKQTTSSTTRVDIMACPYCFLFLFKGENFQDLLWEAELQRRHLKGWHCSISQKPLLLVIAGQMFGLT